MRHEGRVIFWAVAETLGQDASPATNAEGIAGFWRRFFAFFIDGLLLSLPAFIAGIFLFDHFASLGNWGRVIGFIIALMYFGLLNSALTNGQTPGKKCLRIRIVDEANQSIGFGRSSLRFTVLSLPFFLNGAPFLQLAPAWAIAGAAVLVFGFGGAIIYLLIFNRRNRRSLHDLLAGTWVVRTDRESSATRPPTWKGHFVIMVVAAFLCVGLFATLFSFIVKPGTFAKLVGVQRELLHQPDVRAASVMEGTTFFSSVGGDSTSTTYLNVGVRVKKRVEDYDRRANELAILIFETYPEAQIARASVTRGFNFTPAEWQQRLETHPAPQI